MGGCGSTEDKAAMAADLARIAREKGQKEEVAREKEQELARIAREKVPPIGLTVQREDGHPEVQVEVRPWEPVHGSLDKALELDATRYRLTEAWMGQLRLESEGSWESQGVSEMSGADGAVLGHLAALESNLAALRASLKRPSDQPPLEPRSKRARGPEGDSSSLVAIRDQLRRFAQERDWDQFHTPRNICLAMVGEVGELCECFQWKGDAGAGPGLVGWEPGKLQHLGEEMADVLLYLVRLADKCNIDLPEAVAAKLSKNAAKYPAQMVKGSSKKYNEYPDPVQPKDKR